MQFTDTHAHYFDRKFDALPGGAQGVLNDPAFRASVRAVINIGTNLQNSREAVAQAARYPFMSGWIAIGSRWTARASRLSLTVSWRWRSNWICLSSSTTVRRTARAWTPFAATRACAACFTASPDRRKWQKSLSGADFS